jgi:hypothetical protein
MGSVACPLFEKHRTRPDDVHDIRIIADHLCRQGSRTGRVFLPAIALDEKILSLNVPEAAKLRE